MPRIRFDRVAKSFGDTAVIKEFSADIDDKEFLVLLGPSGCGKSTMLRMIAGLADVTSGDIRFDDRSVNALEPKERDVAFVFQSYALYPNMTVRENIAFPLLMQRFRWWHHLPVVATVARRVLVGGDDIRAKVDAVAETLELTALLDRRPKSLSGGQRQRVALARSLVRDPEVYLLDEPLSNLDAKLRGQMRSEIAALYQRVRKTFVYVTHDQVEAMTMATRMIVLNKGEIQQIGTPEEIYDNPANTFVARFIGSPGMNLIPGAARRGRLTLTDAPGTDVGTADDGEYLVGVRPESISVGLPGQQPLPATVTSVEQLGGETLIGFRLGDGDAATTHIAKIPTDRRWALGASCSVGFSPHTVRLFDASTANAVGTRTNNVYEGAR